MRKLIVIAAVASVVMAYAATAGAAVPQHFSFTQHVVFADDTCSFPIAADVVVTNDIIEFDDSEGSITGLQLHQTFAGTWTGNGVTLTENDRVQTFVTFDDGNATEAKHVGLTLHVRGPDGKLFQIADQEVFSVVNGFDRDLLAAHGIDIDFDPATYCSAFA